MDSNFNRCAKCNQNLRIASEQIGIDVNNKPIYKTCGYCDSCMIKYDIHYSNYIMSEPQKKHSTLSILALVFTLITCTCFIGFILAIIDVCINDKDKKHTLSYTSIIICILFYILLAISYGVDKATTTKPSQPVSITQTDNTNVDDIINVDSNGCSLKYLRHEIVEDSLGDKCIAIFYEFTNNSEETTSYMYTFSDQAFQNGIELDVSYFSIEDIEDNGSKDIRPGVSVEVYSLFKPQDDSVVELEVSEWISLSDTPLDTMQLALK